MKIPKHPTLIRRMRDARVRKLVPRGPVLAGSLVQIAKHCGRPGCHCQQGEKHVGWYLTRPVSGKTQTTYVPLALLEEVQGWIQEYRRLKTLTAEISQLNRELIRTHVAHSRRQVTKSSP
jgi:hypothetical protein